MSSPDLSLRRSRDLALGEVWQFRRSLTASAVLQAAAVSLLLSTTLHPRRPEALPQFTKPQAFQVTRISYAPKAATHFFSGQVSGPTRPRSALKAHLSHPTVHGAAPDQSLEPAGLLNSTASAVSSQTLPISVPQPPMPTGPRLTTVFTNDQRSTAREVRLGSFSDALLQTNQDGTGLATARHRGARAAEFGDGFGNGGGPVIRPVRIVSKPVPTYTDEARSHKIQGEVVVEVVFHADGHAEVLRVVQPLGWGLDQAAIDAVEHITFLPASVGGQPIDFQARAHVEFQLLGPSLLRAGPSASEAQTQSPAASLAPAH